MTADKRCSGINITSSKLQFVDLEKQSDKLYLINFGQTFISPSINFEDGDESVLAAKLQTAYEELIVQYPHTRRAVSFTLPPELFITIQLPYDNNLSSTHITEEFRWELSQLFPFLSADDLAIKFYGLNGSILPGNFNALVVALNKKHLVLLKNFCRKNNLSPKLVDNASVTANGFINSHFSVKDSATVNIYNSNNSVTVFINISSKPAYVKVFRKTSDYIGNIFLKLHSEEKIKDIFNRTVKYGFISGDDVSADLLIQIQQASGFEFVRYNPFNHLELNTELVIRETSSEQYSSFIAAAGIAARTN